MGMRIASSGSAGVSQSSAVNNWQQNQQNFKALTSALQSGDLASAQKAFSALTAGKSPNSDSNSPLAKIGQALQNGDLAGAQKAAQSIQGKHHHHGSHSASATASITPSPIPTPTTSSTIGTVVNTTA